MTTKELRVCFFCGKEVTDGIICFMSIGDGLKPCHDQCGDDYAAWKKGVIAGLLANCARTVRDFARFAVAERRKPLFDLNNHKSCLDSFRPRKPDTDV